MGACCSGASKTSEGNLPVSQDYGHTPAHQATVSPLSTGLLVDTNLDTSALNTYRAPPAPIPYEAYAGNPHSSSTNKEALKHQNEDPSQTINAEPVKNPESHEKVGKKIDELEELSDIEDESFDDLKKPTEPYFPPLPVEDDICPICLEEYDEENPKMMTKCDHHYHLACILEWMERSDSCPVCDQAVVLSPALEA